MYAVLRSTASIEQSGIDSASRSVPRASCAIASGGPASLSP